MKTSLILLTVALFSFSTLALGATAVPCDSEFHYPEIGKKELTKVSADKTAFVIDVNSIESFKKNHVTNAVHFDSIESQLAKSLPSNKKSLIIAYCGGPQCGAWKKAAAEACKLGYTNIKHYKGGIQGWMKKS